MTNNAFRQPRQKQPNCRGAGYTLLEMLISMGASAILASGLAAAIAVSTQAWSRDLSPRRQSSTSEATRRIHDDLQHAIQFSERTPESAAFTVPDRDGDGVKELIRYAWTGTPGDPLTVSLNGASPETLIADVQTFQFDWTSRTVLAPGTNSQHAVVFLSAGSGDPGQVSLTKQEELKVTRLQDNNVVVTASIRSGQSVLEPLVNGSSTVYVSGDIAAIDFPAWLAQTQTGIVCERPDAGQTLGLCSGFSVIGSQEIRPQVFTHNVLTDMNWYTGIASSFQPVYVYRQPFSPDLRVLALASYKWYEIVLAATDAGARSANGAFTIPGRRVMLPTGSSGSDFSKASPEYIQLIDNAVAWAAGAGDDAPLDMKVALVVRDPRSPAARSILRYYLLQSLGCEVEYLGPYLTPAQYDTALDGVDAVWITEEVDNTLPASALARKSTGVLIEHPDWLGTMGFGETTETNSGHSLIIPSISHPILSRSVPGEMRVTSPDLRLHGSSGHPAGTQVLASPVNGSSTSAAIAVFDTGAETHIGAAPGRRVWFSLERIGSNDMTPDVQYLIIDALKWLAGN